MTLSTLGTENNETNDTKSCNESQSGSSLTRSKTLPIIELSSGSIQSYTNGRNADTPVRLCDRIVRPGLEATLQEVLDRSTKPVERENASRLLYALKSSRRTANGSRRLSAKNAKTFHPPGSPTQSGSPCSMDRSSVVPLVPKRPHPTTHERDFPIRQIPQTFAVRPRSTRYAYRAPTTYSMATQRCERLHRLEDRTPIPAIDVVPASTYVDAFQGCCRNSRETSIRTGTSSGCRANNPHPKENFLINNTIEATRSGSTVADGLISSQATESVQKDLTPHRHNDTDLVEHMVYHRSGWHMLDKERLKFLDVQRNTSVYQTDYSGIQQPLDEQDVAEIQARHADFIPAPDKHLQLKKVASGGHLTSQTARDFRDPSWLTDGNETHDALEDLSVQECTGGLDSEGWECIDVPKTRYGANTERKHTAVGIIPHAINPVFLHLDGVSTYADELERPTRSREYKALVYNRAGPCKFIGKRPDEWKYRPTECEA